MQFLVLIERRAKNLQWCMHRQVIVQAGGEKTLNFREDDEELGLEMRGGDSEVLPLNYQSYATRLSTTVLRSSLTLGIAVLQVRQLVLDAYRGHAHAYTGHGVYGGQELDSIAMKTAMLKGIVSGGGTSLARNIHSLTTALSASTFPTHLQRVAGVDIRAQHRNGDRSLSMLIPTYHASCSCTADEDGKRRCAL